jgi:hypothetical protein
MDEFSRRKGSIWRRFRNGLGEITLNERTELVVIREGSMTARRYIDNVLEPHVVPFAENMGPEFIRQQDNTHNIDIMNSPPSSPNLNAIEHIWDTLGQHLKERQLLRNLEHVEEILLEEWKEMAPQVIGNLIESMPRRCEEVLRGRGDHNHKL